MSFITNILNFITNPKNRSILVFIGFAILILLFLHQCNRTNKFKEEVKIEQRDKKRIKNNWDASKDSIQQYKLDKNTIRAEKSVYELKFSELEEEYNELLGDFKIEKNKPPTTIVQVEYITRDSIKEIPVYISDIDSLGNSRITLSDSSKFNSNNFRYISADIPININKENFLITPGDASINLELGMNLNLGLFKDKDTGKISIMADTDYPNINFTSIEGANILDDSENKKIIREFRKNFGIGISVGYGYMINTENNSLSRGPYIGIGVNYQPKILQW